MWVGVIRSSPSQGAGLGLVFTVLYYLVEGADLSENWCLRFWF